MLYSPALMHVPDGYLSPLTCLVMFLLVLPFWMRGTRKLREVANARNVPLIALFAAFSFVIMMFNVPLPGGTTGHAVGGALAAIVLGPEVASMAITIALVIQALFFGDGGLLALGANSFNMAVVLPYASYALYRLIAGRSAITSPRRLVGAAIGGYIGLSLSALFTAVEFGLQPLLFTAADGTPLYAPYPLAIAIPAMVIPHLVVASVVEAAVTAGVLGYLQRSNPHVLLQAERPDLAAGDARPLRLRVLSVLLAVLIVATPLGLLAPGTAWGEWSAQQLAGRGLGFVPQGLAHMEGLWGAPLAGYNLPALGNASLGYVLSAVLGIALIGAVAWLLTWLLGSSRPRGKAS